MNRFAAVAICFVLLRPTLCAAGIKSHIAKESAEYVLRKFGKEAGEQSVSTLARKIKTFSSKYGDDAVTAVKKVGPKTFRYVEEAGDNGPQSIRLLARYGQDAVWIVEKKNRMAVFAKYGDDAAAAMMKQGQIAEPLLEAFGKPAAVLLKTVSTRNGRRLAIMADDGTLSKIGRTDELLSVLSGYGDRGMDFVWRNKGALAVASALAAFLANPEPFIEGATELAQVAGENVARPVMTEAAKQANWALLLPLAAVIAGLVVGLRIWLGDRCAGAAKRPKPVTASER